MSESYGPYRAHRIAAKYQILGAVAMKRLADDIASNGQIAPCLVWGALLVDGRNRWRACELAGIAPRVEFREFSSDMECASWIKSNNERRDMSEGARVMLAADPDFIAVYAYEAKKRQISNLRQGSAPVPANWQERGEPEDGPYEADVVDEMERLRETGMPDEAAAANAYGIVRLRHGLPPDFDFDPELNASEPAPKAEAAEQAARDLGVSTRQVYRGQAVHRDGVPELVEAVRDGLVSVSAAEQITKLSHDEQSEVVAAGAAAVREVAAEIRKKPAANFTSLSDLWFTPAAVIDAARELLGGFDLDPASCEEANKNVGAGAFFTQADDGLSRDWHGRVWCNPPYGRDEAHVSNQAKWTAYMADQYDTGNIDAGCLLVTFVPDRTWFERLWNYPMCAFRDRLKFRVPGGNVPDSPTSANVVVYFGTDIESFARIFSRFGRVLVPREGVTEVLDAAA